MTKTLRIMLALGIASMMGLSFATAGETKAETADLPKCCVKAAEQGKECTHECCVKAKAAGEVCKECKPAKKEEKTS